jgi:magnesium-transporting ATPase (P-type)
MTAVQASDYAIPEFRMLWRLVLVHGRWNYLRISKLILYSAFKSVLVTVPRFIHVFYNGFSSEPIYDTFHSAAYNVAFTSVPLVISAILDQDCNYIVKQLDKN